MQIIILAELLFYFGILPVILEVMFFSNLESAKSNCIRITRYDASVPAT